METTTTDSPEQSHSHAIDTQTAAAAGQRGVGWYWEGCKIVNFTHEPQQHKQKKINNIQDDGQICCTAIGFSALGVFWRGEICCSLEVSEEYASNLSVRGKLRKMVCKERKVLWLYLVWRKAFGKMTDFFSIFFEISFRVRLEHLVEKIRLL